MRKQKPRRQAAQAKPLPKPTSKRNLSYCCCHFRISSSDTGPSPKQASCSAIAISSSMMFFSTFPHKKEGFWPPDCIALWRRADRRPFLRFHDTLPARGGNMLQQVNQTEARDLEWACQAVSPMDEPCNSSATFHCGICGRWFCAVHAHDEAWHICALEPGDEGGEA
jgi:hypothetical protein